MTTAPSVPQPNPANIFDAINAYQKSAALKAAIQLDIFTAIARGSRGADAIAKAVSASTRGIRILCDYLVINGFLLKDGDEYSLSADSAMFLNRDSPACFGGTINFMLDPRLIAPYLNLEQIVRTGTTTLPGEGTVVRTIRYGSSSRSIWRRWCIPPRWKQQNSSPARVRPECWT